MNWIGNIGGAIEKINELKNKIAVDFTVGSSEISINIERDNTINKNKTLLSIQSDESISSIDKYIEKYSEKSLKYNTLPSAIQPFLGNNSNKPNLLRVHQMSKKIVKSVPDTALLGYFHYYYYHIIFILFCIIIYLFIIYYYDYYYINIIIIIIIMYYYIGLLALISTELFQRELSKQSSSLPPIINLLANTTLLELDMKLELLSYLKWNMDPFIQAEFENLQTQPLEVLDKFIVNEVLMKIDKDFSPYLSKLIGIIII